MIIYYEFILVYIYKEYFGLGQKVIFYVEIGEKFYLYIKDKNGVCIVVGQWQFGILKEDGMFYVFKGNKVVVKFGQFVNCLLFVCIVDWELGSLVDLLEVVDDVFG